jgi:hypothetical protein
MKRPRLFLACALLAGIALFVMSRTVRRPTPEALLGLWLAEDALRAPSDEMHFYYFHKGGEGLYRYGQVGHNQTHSFDWTLAGDRLELFFRKAGERASTRFTLREENGRRTLELAADPRAPVRTRYHLQPSNLEIEGPLALDGPPSSEGSRGDPRLRMWMHLQHYATGGHGFVMYQLSGHPAQPGWRVGWFHRGDMDDWTTELLGYRLSQDTMQLRFVLEGKEYSTPATFFFGAEGNQLFLTRDPRNFLARTALRDAGPSF